MSCNTIQSTQTSLTRSYLDWKERPTPLNKKVSKSFNKLIQDTSSNWLYNGSYEYNMCGIDEHKLIKKIILQAPPEQKKFYVLDIGAGNFQWGWFLVHFIEEQPDFPSDVKMHIICVRGERNLDDRIIETDRCKLYKIGAFKIEEIIDQFKKQGLFLENKVDIILSRWTFRHFTDPVGTFIQTFNLLRPKTGLLLMDGFLFLLQNQNRSSCFYTRNMIQLLFDTKAPFLMNEFSSCRSMNQFVLQRPNKYSCQLPMSYLNVEPMTEQWQIGSRCVTRFERLPQEEDSEEIHFPMQHHDCLHGDRELYRHLRKNELLETPWITWKPIRERDRSLKSAELHQAVLKGADLLVEKCLQEGVDIAPSSLVKLVHCKPSLEMGHEVTLYHEDCQQI